MEAIQCSVVWMADRDGRNSSERSANPLKGIPVSASISSIAKYLGVSVSTVSTVINGHGYVSPKMRERIERYLREVDYQPNYLARSLRKRETRIIGLIVPDFADSFYSYLSRGAEDFLKSEDYQLIVADSRETWKRQRDYIQTFCRMMTDGILDRKSTRLNSSHHGISYAVFCLKKQRPRDECHVSIRSARLKQTVRTPQACT